MKRVIPCGILLFSLFFVANGSAFAEEADSDGEDLLSGLLNSVETTVTDTTESVRDIVDSATQAVNQTVQDIESFTTDTVETLVDPSGEQPVSHVVDQTVDLVEKTVGNVTPVVENTTKTVQKVTFPVTGIVEEVPEVPVVTPVLDEVGKAVSETVTASVVVEEKVTTDKATTSVPSESGSVGAPQVEKPVVTVDVEANQDEPVTQLNVAVEPEEPTEITVEQPTYIPNEPSQATTAESVILGNVSTETVEMPTQAEPEAPAAPVRTVDYIDMPLAALTTGTTSVVSPTVMANGIADVVGFENVEESLHVLVGRQWVHSDEQMRVQWVHAPPGQPPQSTPFL